MSYYNTQTHAIPGVVNGPTHHYNDAKQGPTIIQMGQHEEPSSYETGVIPPHQRQDVTFSTVSSNSGSEGPTPAPPPVGAGPVVPEVLTQPIPCESTPRSVMGLADTLTMLSY